MKQSGIDWIGEIPDDWKIIRLKHIFQIKKDIAGKEGFTVLSVTQTGIRPKDMSSKGQFALDYSKYQLVNSGEFIMNHMDLKTGWIDISKYNGVTSPDYRVFYLTNNNCIKDYYKQIFQYCYKNLIFFSLGQGVTDLGRWRLPADMFNNFKLPLPPKATQERIAEYLDKKVSEIDSIIEESKKSIEEYKAWKQSVIFEAVTGKNLNCKKKDSGIEWIGEIPEEWEIKRLKNLFDFGKGLPITKENLQETGVSVISYGQIHSKQNSGTKIDDSLKRFVDESYLISNSNSLVHKSDFIFADTSEDLEGCGNCVYVDEEQTLFAGYHTIIFSSKIKQNNKYLAYLFKTDAWRNQIRSRCNGVKLFSITKRILSNVNIVLPPLPEQEAIAKMLDSKCAQIDSLIAEKESLIADLTEYKKSLIFEVVTGKRSV